MSGQTRKSSRAIQGVTGGSVALTAGIASWAYLCNKLINSWEKSIAKNVDVQIQWWTCILVHLIPKLGQKKQEWEKLKEMIQSDQDLLKSYNKLKRCPMLFSSPHFVEIWNNCHSLSEKHFKADNKKHWEFSLATYRKDQNAKQLWDDMGAPEECYSAVTAHTR
jgi:hypothetical protein